jgi:lipopolysaccharide/colanic/teichoic acid biosynthesis glycosyltransferase
MKRSLDILVSFLLILVLSPILIIISIAIRATSPGPPLFVQRRIGLKGRVFRMIKFRTMVPDAEKMGTGLFSFEDDPRVTRLGHFFRRTSLDELPQLLNVLHGSMSLVGPRPPVTYELGPWENYSPELRKRFDVKPGITGLAQIAGRNELTWDQKLVYDNAYVDQSSQYGILLDILILAKTVGKVFFARHTIEKEPDPSASQGVIASLASDFGRPVAPIVYKTDPK